NSEESEPRTQFMVSMFQHCSWKNENLVTSVTTNQKSTEQDYCKVGSRARLESPFHRHPGVCPQTAACRRGSEFEQERTGGIILPALELAQLFSQEPAPEPDYSFQRIYPKHRPCFPALAAPATPDCTTKTAPNPPRTTLSLDCWT
ncbi:hypothetical protein GOODEAATRI_018603, partial [Goodea atripinnis]